jgi:XTP/dITP diphosphohydrolase
MQSSHSQPTPQISSPTSSDGMQQTLEALQSLIEVVAQLRSPERGCPWDLAQTPQTLIPYIVEEAYEVVDALRGGHVAAIVEELGDLLLQVVLQSQIAGEQDQFTLAEVADEIAQKLVRRHPHVFGDMHVQTAEDVHQNWERIKATEKGENPDDQRLTPKLQRYARSLPPLMAALKISQKAAKAGFEWETVDGVWDKFREELAELQSAIAHETKAEQEAELGDLLFTLINIARWYDLDPSAALHGTHERLIQRLQKVESFVDRPLADYTLDELEALWKQAKAQLKSS